MPEKLISVTLKANTGTFQQQMAAAAGSVQTFGQSVNASAAQSSTAISGLGRAAAVGGKALLIGVGGGLAISAKAAIDFESSFAGIRKTVDASEAGFARLASGIRQLATDIPITTTELNRIGELGGQLDISETGLLGFTETIAKVGVTTTLMTDQAALGFARLKNILQLPESEIENLASSMVDLGNNFATTEDQILTFALRIAPVGATVGLTSDQVLGLATAFSSVGVPAERGGTAIQRTFIEIASAVKSGGEDLRGFADVAGESVGDFRELFERDAAAALDAFLTGLGEIDKAGGNVFAILDDLGLGSQRTVASLLAVANAEGILADALDLSSDAFSENIALTEEAEKRFETTASKLQLAKNQFNDLRVEIGTGLLPVIGDTADAIQTLIIGFQSLDDGTKRLIGTVLLVTTGLVAASKVGRVAARVFGIEIATAAASASTQMKILAVASRTVIGLGIVGVIGALGTALFNAAQKQRDFETATRDALDALEQERNGIAGVTNELIQQRLVNENIIDDIVGIGISVSTITEAVKGSPEAISQVFSTLENARERLGSITREINELKAAGATRENNEYYAQLNDDAIALLDSIQAVGDLFGALQREFAAAATQQQAIISSENLDRLEFYKKLMRALAEGDIATVNRLLRETRSAATDAATGFDILSDEVVDANEALRDFIDIELGQRDTAFAFIDSLYALAEAERALGEEHGNTIRNQFALAQAFDRVKLAAANLGPEGLAPAIRSLQEARNAGLITEEQFLNLARVIGNGFVSAANALGKGTGAITFNFQTINNAAQILGLEVQDLIQLLFGLNAAMSASLANATSYRNAIATATSAGRRAILDQLGPDDALALAGGVPATVIDSIHDAFQDAIDDFEWEELGQQIHSDIAAGIAGDGEVEKTIEELIEEARRAAAGAFNAVIAAIDAGLNKLRATEALADAQERLNDLLEEQADLPREIAEAERELTRARIEARRVTLEEQLAIETAEETLKRARIAYQQGRISETELLLAEQAVADARKDSTADTDDVRDAEEKLEDLREREVELARDVRDAQRAIVEAKLDLIRAEFTLISAGLELNKAGLAGVKIFEQIAMQAGFTRQEIDLLREAYAKLAQQAFGSIPGILGDEPVLPGSGGGGSSGGGGGGPSDGHLGIRYTVQSGDSLSRISDRHNYGQYGGWQEIWRLNRNTIGDNPNLIFPGQILSLFQGGVVPGRLGAPVPIIAHGGEVVSNPQLGQGQAIVIENLNVNVRWPVNKQEVDRMMTTLERELFERRRARS